MRRLVVVLVLAAVLLLVLYFAGGSLEGVRQQVPLTEWTCSPKPCASPQGFEADVSDIQAPPGRVTMLVTLRNKTVGGLEATPYRRTSPADFRLSGSDAVSRAPVFAADCPDWGEVRVQRGATAGPFRLCFESPLLGLHGAALLWYPDVGFLSRQISIPLDAASQASLPAGGKRLYVGWLG